MAEHSLTPASSTAHKSAIVLVALGVAAHIVSLSMFGSDLGGDFWKAGVSLFLAAILLKQFSVQKA